MNNAAPDHKETKMTTTKKPRCKLTGTDGTNPCRRWSIVPGPSQSGLQIERPDGLHFSLTPSGSFDWKLAKAQTEETAKQIVDTMNAVYQDCPMCGAGCPTQEMVEVQVKMDGQPRRMFMQKKLLDRITKGGPAV